MEVHDPVWMSGGYKLEARFVIVNGPYPTGPEVPYAEHDASFEGERIVGPTGVEVSMFFNVKKRDGQFSVGRRSRLRKALECALDRPLNAADQADPATILVGKAFVAHIRDVTSGWRGDTLDAGARYSVIDTLVKVMPIARDSDEDLLPE